MKKYFFLFVFLLPCCFCFAQNEPDMVNKWEIGLQINLPDKPAPLMNFNIGIDNTYFDGGDRMNKSFAGGIMLRKQIRKNKSLRIKIGMTNFHIAEHREIISGAKSIDDVDFKQVILNFAPGFSVNGKLGISNFYCGLEVATLIYGKLKSSQNNFLQDISSSSIFMQNSTSATAEGGFAIGPGTFLGFNVPLSDRLLIGGEFSFGLFYRKVGGEINGIYSETVPTNQTIITTYNQTIVDIGMPRLMGSINICYSFLN